MNSRQINFFLTASDQAALLAEIGAGGDFLIISSIIEGEGINFLEGAEIWALDHKYLKVYLVRPDDVQSIRFNLVANQAYRTVDIVKSPVVELVRCFHMSDILRRGRLYFVTSYYEDDRLLKKNINFIKWASEVLTKARQKLKKDPTSSVYFGQEALQLKAGGTKFVTL